MTDLRDHIQSSLGGSYTLEGELGGGGMARVFVATDRSLDRKIVVKVLPPETAGAVAPRPVVGVADQGNGLVAVSRDGQRFLRSEPRELQGLTLLSDWRSKLPRTARK